jgi:hypothetical protein
MKVSLSLNSEQKDILRPLVKDNKTDLKLDFNKCSDFCQYYKLYNNKKTRVIKDVDYILHAHEYDKNDLNTFWLVLNKDLVMLDLCIPLNLDLNNQSMLLNLSDEEIKIIKLLK